MSTFGSAAAAIISENHDGSDEDDDIDVERREIFEEYAYTTFGTLTARRIVEDVQDIRDESLVFHHYHFLLFSYF